MKKLLTLFAIVPMFATAQLGVSIGPNVSAFGNNYQEIKRVNTGVRTGLFWDAGFTTKKPVIKQTTGGTWVYYVKHRSGFGLSTGLFYLHLGERNANEGYRNFSTYHAHLPVMLTATAGLVTFKAGGYVNRILYARNNAFAGPTFGWSIAKWDYWNKYTSGITGGLSYNAISCKLSVIALYGLTEGRAKDWTFAGDQSSKDRAVSVNLEIPFKTFVK